MDTRKIMWMIRAVLCKCVWGHVGWLSYIGKPISIRHGKNVNIGSKVRIQPGMRLETYGNGTVKIENNVSIGQNFHVTSTENEISIGSGTLITGNVFITNIEHGYEDIHADMFHQSFKNRKTKIGNDCFIGFGAGIQAGTVLGNHCVVGANAVVRGSFPDYCVIAGVPAKIIKKYNSDTKIWEKYCG